MKERILKNWTLTRGLYVVIGSLIIVQSVWQREWIMTVMGAYIASMGVFAFGCASGNCFGGSCAVTPEQLEKEKADGADIKKE